LSVYGEEVRAPGLLNYWCKCRRVVSFTLPNNFTAGNPMNMKLVFALGPMWTFCPRENPLAMSTV